MNIFFDFDNKTEILDEDKKKSLYYLNFKANKKDTFKKYLVGDLVYSCYTDKNNKIIEGGNYRIKGQWEGSKKSSFWRSNELIENIDNQFVLKFRKEFQRKIEQIEDFLCNQKSVVLHFDIDGRSWLKQENIVNTIDNIITQDLITKISDDKVVLKKTLYKTIAGEESPLSPNFSKETLFKNKIFTMDEVVSLLYVKNVAEPTTPLVRFGNIGIIALPHSEGLSPESVVAFFERDKKDAEEEVEKEDDIIEATGMMIQTHFLGVCKQ